MGTLEACLASKNFTGPTSRCLSPSLTQQRLIPRYDDVSIDMTTESEPPPWLTITLVVLYYILYPVLLLFKALWYILLLLSTPIIYIGRVVLAMSLIPWRMFTRFEVRHAQIAA